MARSEVGEGEYSLAGISIFAGLSPDSVKRIEKRCAWRRYLPGEPVVDYLDTSEEVFFLVSGEARVTIYAQSGKAVSLNAMGPGTVFGEFPAINHGPRSASVEARTPCLVASMPGSTFRQLPRYWPLTRHGLPTPIVLRRRKL